MRSPAKICKQLGNRQMTLRNIPIVAVSEAAIPQDRRRCATASSSASRSPEMARPSFVMRAGWPSKASSQSASENVPGVREIHDHMIWIDPIGATVLQSQEDAARVREEIRRGI